MTDLDDRVLSEATERGTLRAEDLVALCERYDGDDGPGVPRKTLLAYARELADAEERVALDTRSERLNDQEEYAITDGLLIQELEAHLADEERGAAENGVFNLDGADDRVSAYPAPWHEAIGGETDIRAVLRFLEEAEPFRQDEESGAGKVSTERVIAVASAVGGLDPETARERLADLEDEGEIVEDSESVSYRELRSRESDGEASDLPPVLDFRNALDEIEARAESDVTEDTDAIRATLEAFAKRDQADRESLLSDIDRLTVGVESPRDVDSTRFDVGSARVERTLGSFFARVVIP